MRWRPVAVLLVIALALGGTVLADALARQRAERRIAAELVAELDGVQGIPQVTVHGWPFLSQAATGTLREVTATVAGVTFGDVTATDVSVTAHRVRTGSPTVVGSVEVAGTVPYRTVQSELESRTGLTGFTLAADGDQVTAAGTVLGVAVTATGEPRVTGSTVGVDVSAVTLGGVKVGLDKLPTRLRAALSQIELQVSGLPTGMALTSVTVASDGLRVAARGQDVTLAQSPAA